MLNVPTRLKVLRTLHDMREASPGGNSRITVMVCLDSGDYFLYELRVAIECRMSPNSRVQNP